MAKRSSFKIFLAVQNALFLRELSMRFSSGRMGMFWTFFEPFFQILIFVLIKVLIFGKTGGDFDFSVFLALNFIAFNMFKNIVSKSMGSFRANKALFIYKQVKPIDTIVARTLIELFITGCIILIFFSIGYYFNFDMEVKNFAMVAFGFFALFVFSFSYALFLAILNVFFDSTAKIIGFSMTALMFGSAIVYTLESLPLEFQDILLYNPLTHFMEIIHGFFFYALDDHFVSYSYISLWTLSLLYLALWFYIKLEKRIISA
jgi:capsular polysaccharide transport system permease protein